MSEIERLEAALKQAYEEIGRLKYELQLERQKNSQITATTVVFSPKTQE